MSCSLLVAGTLFSSCEKRKDGANGSNGAPGANGNPGPAGPQGPAGPKLKGTVEGYIALFDQYGSRIMTGIKGDTVKIENTGKIAVTDSLGKYRFDSLETGIYTFNFTKAGYGNNSIQGFQFSGNGTANPRDSRMAKIPDFSVASLVAVDTTVNSVNYVKVSGTLSKGDTKTRTIVFFVGGASTVSSSPSNYVLSFNTTARVQMNNPQGINFSFMIPMDDINNAGFGAGSTLHIAAYGAASNFNNSSTSVDLSVTGRTNFNALSGSVFRTSVVLP